MSIIRAPRPNVSYLVVANEVARDESISDKARGLLVRMLSHPDNWRFSAERLSYRGTGRDAVRAALRELEEAGYIRREYAHDDRGRISLHLYVYDIPNSTGLPMPDKPTTDKPTTVNPSSIEVMSEEVMIYEVMTPRSTPSAAAAAIAGDRFDEFWSVYPRKEKKQAARRAWDKARLLVSADTIVAGATRYAADPNRDPGWTAHASTWLNDGRWDDDPLPPRSDRTRPSAATARETERHERYAAYVSDRKALEA